MAPTRIYVRDMGAMKSTIKLPQGPIQKNWAESTSSFLMLSEDHTDSHDTR